LVAKGLRNKRIDFSELDIIVDVPKPVIMQTLAVRVIYTPYDIAVDSSYNVDEALGGVLTIDLLRIPPPPKRARGWTMRELNHEKMSRFDYPLEGTVATASLAIKVSVLLLHDVIFPSNPRVGWWDSTNKTWCEEGITEIVYNEDTNYLNFNTLKLTSLAILQQRSTNFIKTFWSIKMSTEVKNTAHLIMATQNYVKIHIEITDKGCRLVEPCVKQLASLNTNYLTPEELLKRMAMSGLNITPRFTDDLRFHHPPKRQILEERLTLEIISIICAFEVTCIDYSPLRKHEWDAVVERNLMT